MNLANEILNLYEASVQDQVKKAFDKDVKFEKADPNHSVCSIGFSEKKQAWCGFSHRAMSSFKKGDMLFDPAFKPDGMSEEDLEKLPFVKRGSIKIKTMEQAKEAAKNFARYVS